MNPRSRRAAAALVLALAACAKPVPRGPGPAGLDWVSLPGGTFTMGSDDGTGLRPERVRVGPFQIARTPATVAQYARCVKAGACAPPGSGGRCNWGVPGRDDHPVNCLDWGQAAAFARWAGGRLPSEAQWEYAARGGGGARLRPWGDEPVTCARAVIKSADGDGCGRDATWPVCSKPAGNTPQGLCDMAGEVWEWTADDWHAAGVPAPEDGSPYRDGGRFRAVRGGSFDYPADAADAAGRDFADPGYGSEYLGVRPVRP